MAAPTAMPTPTLAARITHLTRTSLTTTVVMLIAPAGLLGVIGCASAPADTSASAITLVVTATSAEPRPALPDSVVEELTTMAKRSKRAGDATVRVVSSATGEITAIDLTPLRPGSRQVQHAHADAERQIDTALEEIAATAVNLKADTPGLNLLSLLDRASQLPGDLHIISSGISTEAPMDLRILGWNTNADAIIDSIARQGHLPDLAGRHVTFHGLGVAAGSQPSLPPVARLFVEPLWTGICQRAQAASCTVAHDVPTAAQPLSTLPVPVVPVPTAITESGCPVWLNLSDSVLHFSPGSAILPANADDALRPIVQAAARCDIQSIDVAGHIADTSVGDDRDDLAGRRARAMADRLIALGLPPVQLGAVTGRGASEPVIPNFTAGLFDEAKAQQNRRVELTFHRTGR
ncbi:OmpA family protein [Nocardia sp. MW-W600-9]